MEMKAASRSEPLPKGIWEGSHSTRRGTENQQVRVSLIWGPLSTSCLIQGFLPVTQLTMPRFPRLSCPCSSGRIECFANPRNCVFSGPLSQNPGCGENRLYGLAREKNFQDCSVPPRLEDHVRSGPEDWTKG